MRQYQEEYRAPLPKLRFDGLDTRSSPLFVRGSYSPDMRNIDLSVAGGIRKRQGLLKIGDGIADKGGLTTGAQAVALAGDAAKSTMYVLRAGTIYKSSGVNYEGDFVLLHTFASGAAGGGSAVARWTDEVDAEDPETWVYKGAAAYIANGHDRPVICDGGASVREWETYVLSDGGVPPSATPRRGCPPSWEDADGLGNPDWPAYLYYGGASFEGAGEAAEYTRMYAWGFDNEPSMVWYSCMGIPYHFGPADLLETAAAQPIVDGGFFFCMRGDDDEVVGVRQLADLLVVFKRQRTVIYSGGVGTGLELVSILPVGAVSNESIVMAENDIFFWSDGGPRRLSGVIKYGSINHYSIASDILQVVYNVNTDALPYTRGRYEASWNRIVWHVGMNSGSNLDSCLVYYLPDEEGGAGRWSRWDGKYAELVCTAMSRANSAPRDRAYGFSYLGDFYELNIGNLDDEDIIEAYYITSWQDLGALTIRKRLLDLLVAYGLEGRGGVEIEYAVDYSPSFLGVGEPSRSYDSGTGQAGLWDGATWNTGQDQDYVPSGAPGDEYWWENETLNPYATEDEDALYWDVTNQSLLKYSMQDIGFTLRFKIIDESKLGFAVDGMILDAAFKGKN